MTREIINTADGSHTVSIPEMNITYHSRHGAIQESTHVFINAGLKYSSGDLHIFEMGFGTGLNALLTLIEATEQHRNIFYETIEPFPLLAMEAATLNYCRQLQRPDLQPVFDQLHQCEWDKPVAVTPLFTFKKHNVSLINYSTSQPINLLYFDAFAPTEQPELWTTAIFTQLYNMMAAKSTLVTYSSKADVRRAMQAAGFLVEKIPGPYGKREMVRAVKQS
jgi:tRNA U34 5-methylaminomethyl-2-thiouridine-forming methyltransferase MnmC